MLVKSRSTVSDVHGQKLNYAGHTPVYFIVTWPKAAIKHRLWFISQLSMFLSVYKFILHKRFDITGWRQVYPGLSGWEQYGSKTDSTPNLHQMQVLAVTHAPRFCFISHEASLHLSYATCGTEYSSTGAECLTLRHVPKATDKAHFFWRPCVSCVLKTHVCAFVSCCIVYWYMFVTCDFVSLSISSLWSQNISPKQQSSHQLNACSWGATLSKLSLLSFPPCVSLSFTILAGLAVKKEAEKQLHTT